jgi:hypothetical protein
MQQAVHRSSFPLLTQRHALQQSISFTRNEACINQQMALLDDYPSATSAIKLKSFSEQLRVGCKSGHIL